MSTQVKSCTQNMKLSTVYSLVMFTYNSNSGKLYGSAMQTNKTVFLFVGE